MKFAKIILVSEREIFVGELKELLLEKGIDVALLSSSEMLLQQLSGLEADMLVLDGSVQNVQGFTLCRIIRGRYNGPLVLLSTREHEHYSLLALQLGADLSLSADSDVSLIAENLHSLLRCLSVTPVFEMPIGGMKINNSTYRVS